MSGKYLTALFITALCTLLTIPAGNTAVLAVNALPLEGKTIVLDPGHGGSDHGYCRQNSLCERDIALEITEKTAALLKKSGARVYMTRGEKTRWLPWRADNSETSLVRRISMARTKKADIFVSVHCNASPRPHRTGAVVFYRDNFNEGQRLGDSIQKELVKIPENGKRTDRPGNYFLLNALPVPAVVIESCYLTHWTDKQNILNPEYQQKFALAVFSGIERYFSGQGEPNGEKAVVETSLGYPAPKKATGERGGAPLKNTEAAVAGGIEINSIEVKDSQAQIDVRAARAGLSLGGEEEYLALHTLVNNVLKDPGIQSALVTVNGAPAKTLAGHMDISSPITRQNPVCARIPLGTTEGKKAQVAIVIDDFGQYKPEGLKEILSLDIPVTCAVMPNMENTRIHAEEASGLGHEVIVHLPLEPVRGREKWLGPGAITVGMPEDLIKALAVKDFESVPHAVGFNNHMGSAVTANEGIMRAILQVAREKQFFVLDSKTTQKTKIPSLAGEMGIPCLDRTIFLDDIKRVDHVKGQLLKLSQQALAKGKAVGIGHVGQGGRATARALEEMIPEMEKMGIEFVYLSEMAY